MFKPSEKPAALVLFGYSVLVICLALCGFAPHASAETLDNRGREFMLSFLPNLAHEAVELHLSSEVTTSVTVNYPVNAPTFSTTVSLTPGNVAIVALPLLTASSWMPDLVMNNAVSLSGPDEFVAYLVNRASATSDAAMALPIDALNTEYIASTYDEAFFMTEVSIVAPHDSTLITVTPSNDLQGGHPAHLPYSFVLNRGEGILLAGAVNGMNGGLAGSIIQADKPVAVTNGNGCTQVPYSIAACDHMFEVAQPVQTWGSQALLVNLPNRAGGSVYRVLAARNNTEISRDGVAIGTINHGQFLEIGPLTGNHVLSATQPIFVTQYMTGLDSPGAVLGDPSMGNVIPTEQFANSYTFSTVGGAQFGQHWLTVVAANADLGSLTLDGVALSASSFSAISGTGFSAAYFPLTEGVHSTSSAHPHGISVEGYNSYDSYLYPGGARFETINPVVDPNANTDCAGTVNGSAVVDRCGVCAGDGLSCLQCTEVKTTSRVRTIRKEAARQKLLAEEGIKVLAKILGEPLDASSRKYIARLNGYAEANYSRISTLTTKISTTVLQCANVQICKKCSTLDVLTKIKAVSKESTKFAWRINREIRVAFNRRCRRTGQHCAKTNPGRPGSSADRLSTGSNASHDSVSRSLKRLPQFSSQCS